MNEEGPTQEEMEKEALSGLAEVDEASLIDPFAASPEETQDPATEESDPDSTLADQVRELREQLQVAEKRTHDNQAAFRTENNQRHLVEGILAAEEAKRQREYQIAQAAKMREMPQAPDMDEYDPKAVVKYAQDVAKWAAAQGQLASHGVSQALTQAMPRFENLVNMAKSNAAEIAANKLSKWGFDEDFRSRLGEIETRLSQQGDPTDLLMNPDMLMTAYQLDRNQRGLPMVAAVKSKPPTVAPTTPGLDVAARSKRINPMMAHIAKNLGMEPFDPTEDELSSISQGSLR
jgi:hypothetical protein